MEFKELTKICQKLEKTSSRLEMTDIISEFISHVPEKLLPTVCLFLKGNVFPPWSDKETGIAEKTMIKALSSISGMLELKIDDLVREKGDTGLVAEEIMVNKTQKTLFQQTLTVEKLYENLERISALSGKGSQEKKIGYITEVLSAAEPEDERYVVRFILGELRLGVGDGIIRDAIAKSFNVTPEEVEWAYNLTSDLGEAAKTAKLGGSEALSKIPLTVGRPLKVMLAQKAPSILEVLKEYGSAAFEIKYDGARIQVHKQKNKIDLYTRRQENVTKQFPEIVDMSAKNILAESAIVEGEIVAIKSLSDRTPRPFQDLSKRIKRKYDIKEMVEKIPVEINLFDIIALNNKSTIQEEFNARRKILKEIIHETGTFKLAEQLITSNPSEAQKFYEKALAMGHEGVMVKNLQAPYKPGSRVGYMYKIKPILETLDLVAVGATWGEGRRASWLGSYLLAVREPDTGHLLEIGRMATGLSDQQLAELTEVMKPHMIEQSGKEVKLKPTLVMEVAYEEIQKSPTYNSGYALRFPRLVRVREDKGVEDADTLERVESIIKGSQN